MGLPVRKLILATNENDVLDEFFRSGVYRVRPSERVQQTSSPSMDISKASNFERFVFDLVGRDARAVAALWRQLEREGVFDLSQTPHFQHIAESGFVSGSSRHADRLETIRSMHRKYRQIVDTHTADGIKVGLEHREPGVPLVCLETALPAKFAATIREAIGFDPEVPYGLEGLERLPQRFCVIDADDSAVKDLIVRTCDQRVA
jgi:threonine synthase